jgi:hypothetical protein
MINYRDDIFFRHVIVYTSFFFFFIISSLILNVWASSGRSFSRGPPGGAAVVDAHNVSHRVFTRFFWLVLTGGIFVITSSTGSKTGFGLHSSDTVVYRHFILVKAKNKKFCGLSSDLVFLSSFLSLKAF